MRLPGTQIVAGVVMLALGPTGADAPALRGYSDAAARTEQAWEARLRAVPDPAVMRESMRRLSARPHHVGSAYDRDNAEWILARFKSWGLDARIETFDVLFPTPKERTVELVAPTHFVARLQEPALPGDPTSNQRSEQLPTYNAYSIDGDVTAPLVYVNYGLPEDYVTLARLGVSVKGAIVLARYGHSWRGIKPKAAAEHGAVGCLIYSDPREDGYFGGKVMPEGPWRPPDGVQRGSVLDMLYQGDPLTPGIGATKDAARLPLKEVRVLTRIPVMPLSYADAEPLLRAIDGPMAPEEWRGALPTPYHVGPGPAKVHLAIRSSWDLATIYDVLATIPGAVEPEQWVVRGNHHDAWVNGAEDPVSGLVSLLEEARACGELLKQGWRPRRTIVYAAWDGEEAGCLGSTEWAETHASELSEHAVAYVNSDSNGRGYFDLGGSASLEAFLNGVARDIADPESGVSAWKRLQLHLIQQARSDAERRELREREDLRTSALGAGSDYVTFLHHLGIPCLSLGFGGEDEGGIYHSIYDDFYWYTRFSDTTFAYGRALAQAGGTAVVRLADAELLPFGFTGLADATARDAQELEALLKARQDEAREVNLELQEGAFAATADPRKPRVPPAPQEVPPHLNFAPLRNGVEAVQQAAAAYERALAAARERGGEALSAPGMRSANRALLAVDRAMLDPAGLPRRPWYRNMVVAPGMYTGYGVKTLPMAREGIELGTWPEAEEGLTRAGRALEAVATAIRNATAQVDAGRR